MKRPFGPALLSAICSEVQAWIAHMPIGPGNPVPSVASLISLSRQIQAWKASGWWQAMGVIMVATNTLANSMVNLKDPTRSFTPSGNLICVPYTHIFSPDRTGEVDTGYTILASGIPAWAPATNYANLAIVNNGSQSYIATHGGVSGGAPGPTGTGMGIVDGGVTWKWNGKATIALPDATITNVGGFAQVNQAVSSGIEIMGANAGGSFGLRPQFGASVDFFVCNTGGVRIAQPQPVGYHQFSSVGRQSDGSNGTYDYQGVRYPYINTPDAAPVSNLTFFGAGSSGGSAGFLAAAGFGQGMTEAQHQSGFNGWLNYFNDIQTYVAPPNTVTANGQSFGPNSINHVNPPASDTFYQAVTTPPVNGLTDLAYGRWPSNQNLARFGQVLAPAPPPIGPVANLTWNNRQYPPNQNYAFGQGPNDAGGSLLNMATGFFCGANFSAIYKNNDGISYGDKAHRATFAQYAMACGYPPRGTGAARGVLDWLDDRGGVFDPPTSTAPPNGINVYALDASSWFDCGAFDAAIAANPNVLYNTATGLWQDANIDTTGGARSNVCITHAFGFANVAEIYATIAGPGQGNKVVSVDICQLVQAQAQAVPSDDGVWIYGDDEADAGWSQDEYFFNCQVRAALAHGQGLKIATSFDPLSGAGIALGLTAVNAPAIMAMFDGVIVPCNSNSDGATQLNNNVSVFRGIDGSSPINYRKVIVNYGLGRLTPAQAPATVAFVATANGWMRGIGRVNTITGAPDTNATPPVGCQVVPAFSPMGGMWASFSASIAGTTLTVTAPPSSGQSLLPEQVVQGVGVLPGQTIVAQLTSTAPDNAFTGSVAGAVLTVTAVGTGQVQVGGAPFTWSGGGPALILSQAGGAIPGGIGTYNLDTDYAAAGGTVFDQPATGLGGTYQVSQAQALGARTMRSVFVWNLAIEAFTGAPVGS